MTKALPPRRANVYGKKAPLLALGAAALTLLLASCVGPGAASPTVNPLDRSSDKAAAAWEIKLKPIAQPAVAGGVALIYAKSGNTIRAHAVSVATGKELWTKPIHPGVGAVGIALAPALTKTAAGADVAVFLQSATTPPDRTGVGWWTTPMAVDLKTGKMLYRGETQLIEARPAACDDEKDMCFTTYDLDTGKSIAKRVNLATGKVSAGTAVMPLTGNFRPVGDGGLYSVVNDGSESLSRVVSGKTVWSADLTTLFGPNTTTNLGWAFEYSKKLDVYVGSVGYNPVPGKDINQLIKDGFSVDLSKLKTVGFSASTGKVLWTATGSDLSCAKGLEATKLEDGNSLPIRCEYVQGQQRIPSGQYTNLKAKIVGYDPTTGKAGWQTEATTATDINKLLVPTSGRGETALAKSTSGLKLINTTDGTSRLASPQDVFLCEKGVKYPLPPNSPVTLPADNQGTGGTTAFPCSKDGTKVPALTSGAIADIAAVDGGIAVLAQEDNVSGYKIS